MRRATTSAGNQTPSLFIVSLLPTYLFAAPDDARRTGRPCPSRDHLPRRRSGDQGQQCSCPREPETEGRLSVAGERATFTSAAPLVHTLRKDLPAQGHAHRQWPP